MEHPHDDNSAFFVTPETPAALDLQTLQRVHRSQSGYSEVYRVDRMGRFRALKCLKPDYRGNPLYENLLRKEFEIGYGLSHPNICEYYSLSDVEGLGSCIEMEWVDGRTLEYFITEGERPAPAVCDAILDELCDALSYIHAKQVLHRDLKPSNILVTYNGCHVKLIDFGFSDSDGHSILKTPAGTQEYAAPEVLSGGTADVRSEIWTLGLIIATLTRRHREVVRKCCKKRPSLRYASVAEVKKALHSRAPLWSGILLIALLILGTLIPYLGRKEASAPVQEPAIVADSTAVQSDTVSHPETIAPAAKEIAHPKTAPDQQKAAQPKTETPDEPLDPAVIDELFRQATELFD